MTEGKVRRPQRSFTQGAEMGMQQGKSGVVADSPDVAEVVGKPFKFRHQCPEPDRPRRNLELQGRFRSHGERPGIGDRAISGNAAGQLCCCLKLGAGHQRLDALVCVAQTLLEPHYRFAVGSKAEMPRLYDAGMHRTHRNLMQALALDWKERVGRLRVAGHGSG